MTALTMDNADLVFVVVTSTAQLRIGKFVPLMGRSLTVNVKLRNTCVRLRNGFPSRPESASEKVLDQGPLGVLMLS